MTLVEAFKKAVEAGRPIRRSGWAETATLEARQLSLGGWYLLRSPERRNWSGEFSPSLDDLEAFDWEVV